ncbi:MAG: T9SS type A sorting domain-containing protein [bacterium]
MKKNPFLLLVATVLLLSSQVLFAEDTWPYIMKFMVSNGDGEIVENEASMWIGNPDEPVKGIILTSMTRNEREFNHDPHIRAMATEMNLALIFLYGHVERDFYWGGSLSVFNPDLGHDTVLQKVLKDLSVMSGKPEIEHAPWLTFGHSTSGLFARYIAWWKPERMFGVILYKSGGYVPPDFVEDPDTSTFLNIPWLSVAARNDKFGPGQQGWNNMRKDMMPWRARGALMSQIVEPTMEEGHSVWRSFNGPYFAMWIKKAVEGKIPENVTSTDEPVNLSHIPNSSGMLSDSAIARLIDKEELSDMLLRYQYDVEENEDRDKMFWHFDDEMAITWVNYHHKEYGEYDPPRDTSLSGTIKYWRDNTVFGSPENTARVYGQSPDHKYPFEMSVETDSEGTYEVISYDRLLRISREIPGDYSNPDASGSILHAINGYDAFLLKKIITESEDYIPALPDMLAADVNMDGIVNQEDLEQLTSRAVLSIAEFKQKWNYQGTETPIVDKSSLDYVFFDNRKTSFNLEAKISKNYPADDGIGYSRYRFPSISDTVIAPYETGNPYPDFLDATFLGLMPGDIDGSDALPEGQDENFILRIGMGNKTVSSGFLMIPVFVESRNNDPVKSADAEIIFKEGSFSLDHLETDQNSEFAVDMKNDHLYIVSYHTGSFNLDEPAFYIAGPETELSTDDILAVRAYINGKECISEVLTNPLGNSFDKAMENLTVFPNPVKGLLKVILPGEIKGEFSYQLMDLSGRILLSKESIVNNDHMLFLNTDNLNKGYYILRLFNDKASWIGEFIKEVK